MPLTKFNKGQIGTFSFVEDWGAAVNILEQIEPLLPFLRGQFKSAKIKHSEFYPAIITDHDVDANNAPIHAWEEAEFDADTSTFTSKTNGANSSGRAEPPDPFHFPAYHPGNQTMPVGSVVFLRSARDTLGGTSYWIVTAGSEPPLFEVSNGSPISGQPNRWTYSGRFQIADPANAGQYIYDPANPTPVTCYNRLESGNTSTVVFPGVSTASMLPSTLQPVFGGGIDARLVGGVWTFAEENPWSPCT